MDPEKEDSKIINQTLSHKQEQRSSCSSEIQTTTSQNQTQNPKSTLPLTVNSIFGPEGLLAKFDEDDHNNDDHERERDLRSSRPRPLSVSGESMDQDDLDLRESHGDQNTVRSLKKRKIFPGPNDDSDHVVNVGFTCSQTNNKSSLSSSASSNSIKETKIEQAAIENETDAETEIKPDPPPVQKAFEIELIVKKIFSYLDIHNLKKTRFVCTYWAQLGSKALQKRLKIIFHFKEETSLLIFPSQDYYTPENLQSLTSLTALLHNKETISKAKDLDLDQETQNLILSSNSNDDSNSNSPLNSNSTSQSPCCTFDNYDFEFPCNFYEFYVTLLNLESLDKFLTSHGSHIRKLKLYLNYSSQEAYMCSDLKLLQKLLVDQCPYLNYLELRIDISEEVEESTTNLPFLLKSKTQSESDNPEVVQLPNLTILKMWDGVHRGILEGLFLSAINLREVSLETDNLHYLMESPTRVRTGNVNQSHRNRLHLLKKLTLDLDYDDVESMEVIASHCESLRLRKLVFHLNHQYPLQKHWPRVTCALNKILKSSASTLEKITWGPIGVLKGIEIPRMPKLTKLTIEIENLVNVRDENVNANADHQHPNQHNNADHGHGHGHDHDDMAMRVGRNEYFFPRGFNISTMFPKLSSLFMLNGWMIAKYGFSSYFNIAEDEPVHSLKYFRINHMSRNRISKEDMLWFSNTFPNAQLLFWPNISSSNCNSAMES